MAAIKHTIEQINALMAEVGGCHDGIQLAKDLGVYGMEIDEAITTLRSHGHDKIADWLESIKSTPAYVKYNGSVITMGIYKVFNPLDGLHEEYQTEEQARSAACVIAHKILDAYKISVVQAMSNENGDSTWVPITFTNELCVK
jgi:hypothetical protein